MRKHHVKGATLVEVAVAMVVLAICVVAGFSAFSLSQTQMIAAAFRSQLTMVAQNEAERVLSIKYDQVVNASNQTIVIGGRTFTVSTVVTTINPGIDPHWKQVDITATSTYPQETVTMRVLKSP